MSEALAALGTSVAMHPHGAWGWGPGPWIVLVPLFWIALVALLFALFGRRWRRAARENGPGVQARRQAETTLAERFAKGDIDEVEYRARLEVLRANATP